MTLEFKETEAVKFGKLVVVPSVDAELKLRISRLKFNSGDSINEAIQTLSKAFGSDSLEVKEFMEKNMGANQLQKLQAYLVGGEDGLQMYERQMNRLTDKMMDKALEGDVND